MAPPETMVSNYLSGPKSSDPNASIRHKIDRAVPLWDHGIGP